MASETNVIEYGQAKAETLEVKRNEKGEIRFFGVRALMTLPISACQKIDRMFGSGGEAIVHYMCFESGRSLLDDMIKCNPGRNPEELLNAIVNVQPRAGWGYFSMKIHRIDPPIVDIALKNPPVKTLRGSQKYLIGSFWAGVLSRYFNRQLMCKDFGYDADKDEFTCTVTT